MLIQILKQAIVENNFFDEWTRGRELRARILHMFLGVVVVVGHLFLLLVTCFCLPAGPWIELTTGRPSWVALTRYGKLVVVCVYRPTPRLDLYLDGRSAPFISCHISHVLERVTGLGPLYSLNSGDTVATGAAGRSHWGHTVYIEYLSTTDWKMLLKATMKIYHIFLHSTL